MAFESDGINTKEIFRAETGQKLYSLVRETIQKFQLIIAEAKEIDECSHSLMAYMANNSIMFIQFIEMLTSQYKFGMADAYQQSGEDYDRKFKTSQER